MTAPYQPMVPESGRVESFDLNAMGRELMDSEAFRKSGRVARTLARADDLTAVLTVMKKGAELHDHSSPGPATVTVLSGQIVLRFDNDAGDAALGQGSTVVFAKNTGHRVEANEDSVFLIVIGGRTSG